MDIALDKEKYFRIVSSEGLSKALTELHHEMWDIEFQCFEGAKGYQPELYEKLKEFRAFSTELWNISVR